MLCCEAPLFAIVNNHNTAAIGANPKSAILTLNNAVYFGSFKGVVELDGLELPVFIDADASNSGNPNRAIFG